MCIFFGIVLLFTGLVIDLSAQSLAFSHVPLTLTLFIYCHNPSADPIKTLQVGICLVSSIFLLS